MHPRGRPSSWLLAASVIAAFALGGLALILRQWWLVGLCAALVAAAAPVGVAIGITEDSVVDGTRSGRARRRHRSAPAEDARWQRLPPCPPPS